MRCDAKIPAMRVLAAESLCDALPRCENTSDCDSAMPATQSEIQCLIARYLSDVVSVGCMVLPPAFLMDKPLIPEDLHGTLQSTASLRHSHVARC